MLAVQPDFKGSIIDYKHIQTHCGFIHGFKDTCRVLCFKDFILHFVNYYGLLYEYGCKDINFEMKKYVMVWHKKKK